jgi:hypothetical protein
MKNAAVVDKLKGALDNLQAAIYYAENDSFIKASSWAVTADQLIIHAIEEIRKELTYNDKGL